MRTGRPSTADDEHLDLIGLLGEIKSHVTEDRPHDNELLAAIDAALKNNSRDQMNMAVDLFLAREEARR